MFPYNSPPRAFPPPATPRWMPPPGIFGAMRGPPPPMPSFFSPPSLPTVGGEPRLPLWHPPIAPLHSQPTANHWSIQPERAVILSVNSLPPLSSVTRKEGDTLTCLSVLEQRILGRRKQIDKTGTDSVQGSVSCIPVFRAQLRQWVHLLERARELRNKGLPVPSDLEAKLHSLQQQCSDPNSLQKVKRKLNVVLKKRRRQKRHSQDRQETSPVVIVRTPVASTLEIAREHGLSDVLLEDGKKLSDRKAVDMLKSRLALLDDVEKLRTARVSQARQKGGLFPEHLDEEFAEKIDGLRHKLTAKLNELLPVDCKPCEPTSKHEPPPSCCGHDPHLDATTREVVFGSSSSASSAKPGGQAPWRWQRFYHQADFNFADFVRVRHAWDAYLLPDSGAHADSDPNALPITWYLPSADEEWHLSSGSEQCDPGILKL